PGTYKRTKKHREEFGKRMTHPEIIRKRERTKRKNREEKIQIEKKEESIKNNKSDMTSGQINNLDKDELNDKLEGLKHRILKKVKELGGNLKSLQNLQEERDRIEIRLEELGMKF
ncbi:unnamed protein product, partial [marine sediment metagenome]